MSHTEARLWFRRRGVDTRKGKSHVSHFLQQAKKKRFDIPRHALTPMLKCHREIAARIQKMRELSNLIQGATLIDWQVKR